MRITVKSDNYTLLDTNLDSYKLIKPKTVQEVNKVGSFTFTIYPDHPHFDFIHKMKSIITIYEEGISEPLFRGRIYDEKEGFYGEKQVSCEGELAFLLDSIQRPWEFTGTPEELFKQFIAAHNAQVDVDRQFTVGKVTVTDPNDYITRSDSEYKSTWKCIEDKLIKMLGGYLWVRHENGINYIDYLEDFTVLSSQSIQFGKNLLDLSKQIKAVDFATAIIPLGAKLEDSEGNDTDERLTIKSVNNGVDFVYNAEAVAQYDYIFTTNTWNDVTDATNLKRKAQEYIDNMAQFTASINVTAADLAGATVDGVPANVNSFRIGRYVKVETKPHGLDSNFIVSKLTRELLSPESTKLTLGTTYKSLTEQQKNLLVLKGEKGDKGNTGNGVENITEEYYLSTSKTEQVGGSWVTTAPAWSSGKYIWTRSKIIYTSGDIAYTKAVCDSSWEAVNNIEIGARNLLINSNYTENNKYTLTATTDNFLKITDSKALLEQGQEYIFSCLTDGTWGEGVVGEEYVDTVEAYLLLDGKYTTYFRLHNNTGFIFIPPTTGTYHLRFDVNQNGATHSFWNFQIERGNKKSDWKPAVEDVDGLIGQNVKSVDVMYYLSTSATALKGGLWVTTAPTWENGKYIWTKTITVLANGESSETTPVCITGAKGEKGKDAAVQSATAPSDTSYMWLDISVEPALLKRYNSTTSSWEAINDTTAITDSIVVLQENVYSDISKNTEEILMTVAEEYYAKAETDTLISEVSTEFSQTKDSFEMKFNTFEANLADVVAGTDAEFEEIKKYIRFVDGKILLGEVGNQLELQISNDRISFLQDNAEVAYFSDRKLYVTDGEYTNSLQLGSFAFIPRSNGNLSFKKIT